MSNSVTAELSENASQFDDQYNTSGNFIQRYLVWTSFIDKYSEGVKLVYDIGCGPGVFSLYTAKKGIETEGWDGAEGMISLCNKKKKKAGLTNVSFHQHHFPVADTSLFRRAGLVMSSSVIEYIDDINGMISMLDKLTEPGGILLVSLPNAQSLYRKAEKISYHLTKKPAYLQFVRNWWSLEEAKSRFSQYGFKYLEHSYYADRSIIGKMTSFLSGGKYAGSLFIAAFQKA